MAALTRHPLLLSCALHLWAGHSQLNHWGTNRWRRCNTLSKALSFHRNVHFNFIKGNRLHWKTTSTERCLCTTSCYNVNKHHDTNVPSQGVDNVSSIQLPPNCQIKLSSHLLEICWNLKRTKERKKKKNSRINFEGDFHLVRFILNQYTVIPKINRL